VDIIADISIENIKSNFNEKMCFQIRLKNRPNKGFQIGPPPLKKFIIYLKYCTPISRYSRFKILIIKSYFLRYFYFTLWTAPYKKLRIILHSELINEIFRLLKKGYRSKIADKISRQIHFHHILNVKYLLTSNYLPPLTQQDKLRKFVNNVYFFCSSYSICLLF